MEEKNGNIQSWNNQKMNILSWNNWDSSVVSLLEIVGSIYIYIIIDIHDNETRPGLTVMWLLTIPSLEQKRAVMAFWKQSGDNTLLHFNN